MSVFAGATTGAALLGESQLDVQPVVKCNTCMAAFLTIEKAKDHYHTAWHVFNAKRRANDLPPIRKDDFKLLQNKVTSDAAAKEAAKVKVPTHSNKLTIKNGSTTDGGSSIASSSRMKDSLFGNLKAAAAAVGSQQNRKAADTLQEEGEEGDDRSDGSWSTACSDDEEAGEGADGGKEGNGEKALRSKSASAAADPVPLGTNISIFDNKAFETTDECVQYMASTFGFFIPDAEYLTDLDGLLTYLGEKVKLGGYCLYCQKHVRSARACQNHMISTSHCKLAYEEGVDLEEFEDFYDFSSSYEALDALEEAATAVEDEGGSDDDEEGEWEDDDGDDGLKVKRKLEVTAIGELVLPSGKTVGNRAYRRYYKQHYRAEESRDSVLAQQREELLRLTHKFGSKLLLTHSSNTTSSSSSSNNDDAGDGDKSKPAANASTSRTTAAAAGLREEAQEEEGVRKSTEGVSDSFTPSSVPTTSSSSKAQKQSAAATAVGRMSNTEVMSALVSYQKQVRKGQVLEQRMQRKRENMQSHQRQEYKSTVDKLRSSATTTQKIRDYHSIIQ